MYYLDRHFQHTHDVPQILGSDARLLAHPIYYLDRYMPYTSLRVGFSALSLRSSTITESSCIDAVCFPPAGRYSYVFFLATKIH